MKRLVRSERSDDDVREVAQYLLREACASVALRFIDALEESYLLLHSRSLGSVAYMHRRIPSYKASALDCSRV